MSITIGATAKCDVCNFEQEAVWDDDRWIPPRTWIIVRVETADHPIGLSSSHEFDAHTIACARAGLAAYATKLPDPHAAKEVKEE